MAAELPLLEVSNLRVSVGSRARRQTVADGVSFAAAAGETLCIVGESGCGKSLTALA